MKDLSEVSMFEALSLMRERDEGLRLCTSRPMRLHLNLRMIESLGLTISDCESILRERLGDPSIKIE